MKVIIINLSPRKKGTSKMLTKYFADRITSHENEVTICDLYSYLEKMDVLLDNIKISDVIIMIGPCYVDSFPADTINLLCAMADSERVLHGQSLYGFIQGGMPYIHTHEHGIRLLENFAAENALEFKGGFVMGGGAMLNGQPLDKIIGAKKMVPAVNKFVKYIISNEYSPKELYQNATMKIPLFITKILAFAMNKRIKKDLTSKGIDYNRKSPYVS